MYVSGSSERGNKSEDDDEGEFDDGCEEKNSFSSTINHDENIVNGHNLPTTDIPFPWNITLGNNAKQKQHQDDKVAAAPPQLLLTSGQLTTGCLQAAQLLIPTARGKKIEIFIINVNVDKFVLCVLLLNCRYNDPNNSGHSNKRYGFLGGHSTNVQSTTASTTVNVPYIK